MSAATRARVATEPQENALWLLERLSPGTAANNLSVTFAVDAALDVDTLDRALTAVVNRHEVLRSGYVGADGTLVREQHASIEGGLVTTLAVVPAELDEALASWVRRPFELDGRPLVRAALVQLEDRSVVSVVLHHLIFDTVSAVPFLRDLIDSYEQLARSRGLPARFQQPLPRLEPAAASAGDRHYWLTELAGYDPATVHLACALPENPSPTLSGAVATLELSADDRQNLRNLQRIMRAPESTVLLSAFWLLLHGHGAGSDIVIGNPVNTRARSDIDAIGYHVNVLPLRLRIDRQQTVRELNHLVRDQFFSGMAHLNQPVDELTPLLLPRDNGSWRSMLVNHVFNYVNSDVLPEFHLAGAPTRTIHVENGTSKFDVELFVISVGDRLRLRLAYNTGVLSADTAVRLLQRYAEMLNRLADAPDLRIANLEVWSEHDHAVIDKANSTTTSMPSTTVYEQLRQRATFEPGAVAVVQPGREARWQDLVELADRYAVLLARSGVTTGDVVGLCLPRGIELAAAVLAVWQIGTCYLPIDRGLPAERIRYILTDSGAMVVLSDQDDPRLRGHGADLLLVADAPVPDSRPSPVPTSATSATTATSATSATSAYLIYTSGSTGRPKGTRIGHRALANLVAHFQSELNIQPSQRMLWSTSFSFDISALELLTPLAAGASVVVAPDAARSDGAAMRAALSEGIDYVQATPTTWRLVLPEVVDVLGSVVVLVGGESLPLATARNLAAAARRVHHVYGPTETTIWSSSQLLPAEVSTVLVGRPIANTVFVVLDSVGRPLPIGVRGELWIGGEGVAEGYHARSRLTAERFIERGGVRGYRTGDVAQWAADGQLQLFGRSDRQVKIRGNRIELGEIEAVLGEHGAVRSAAVVVVGLDTADAQLVGFVELHDHELLDDVWEFARTRLPHGYLPQQLVAYERLPVNMSNKIDYPILTERAGELLACASTAVAPAGPASTDATSGLTAQLVRLWRELLDTGNSIDADTHFFRSGGHSVLGALLVQRVKKDLGITIALAELFEAPTPTLFAARIAEAGIHDAIQAHTPDGTEVST